MLLIRMMCLHLTSASWLPRVEPVLHVTDVAIDSSREDRGWTAGLTTVSADIMEDEPRTQYSVEPPPDKDIWVVCGDCRRTTRHRALVAVEQYDEVKGEGMQWWVLHYIIQCQGCHHLSFCRESRSTEDTYHDDFGEEHMVVGREVYPLVVEGLREMEHAWRLPHNVRRIYDETYRAVSFGQPILAGAGIRTIVEAVAKERGASGRDLKSKIDDLKEKALITPTGAEILHSLRFMGNVAVHEAAAHGEDELRLGLQVIEHLLTGVYILPQLNEVMRRPTNAGA